MNMDPRMITTILMIIPTTMPIVTIIRTVMIMDTTIAMASASDITTIPSIRRM